MTLDASSFTAPDVPEPISEEVLAQWSAAMSEVAQNAGLELPAAHPAPGGRYPDAVRSLCVDFCRFGAPVSSIAATTGVREATVRRWVAADGAPDHQSGTTSFSRRRGHS